MWFVAWSDELAFAHEVNVETNSNIFIKVKAADGTLAILDLDKDGERE